MATSVITPPPNQKMSSDDFAASIKSKYPQYASMDNQSLTTAIVAKYPQYADKIDNVPRGTQPPPDPTFMQQAGEVAKDVGKGIIKGGLNTTSTLGGLIHKTGEAIHPGLGEAIVPQSGLDAENSYKQTHNIAQKVGYGGEQAGEFLVPGLGEEAAVEHGGLLAAEHAPQIAKFAKPIAKLGYQGLTSGLINKSQGGNFGTGAATGVASGLIGMGAKAAAPAITEFAQGIHTPGQKAGKAILNETSGLIPSSIRKSASGVLGDLNPELNRVAEKSTASIPMESARTAASEQIQAAANQNQKTLIKGTKKLGDQLMERTSEPALGAEGPSGKIPIPREVSAPEYLNLKRGIGKSLPAGSWSPESTNAFKPARNAVYGTMNKEFEQAVPEAAPLNRRISALIPATKEGKSTFGHAAGPAVGALIGGGEGYREDGLTGAAKGALIGGTAGTVAPALLNAGARTVYSPAAQKLLIPALKGAALQSDRN